MVLDVEIPGDHVSQKAFENSCPQGHMQIVTPVLARDVPELRHKQIRSAFSFSILESKVKW